MPTGEFRPDASSHVQPRSGAAPRTPSGPRPNATRRTPQKERQQKNPEGEEHQPPLLLAPAQVLICLVCFSLVISAIYYNRQAFSSLLLFLGNPLPYPSGAGGGAHTCAKRGQMPAPQRSVDCYGHVRGGGGKNVTSAKTDEPVSPLLSRCKTPGTKG